MIACGGAIDASLLKERANYEVMMKLNTDSVSLKLVYACPECPFQAKLMTSLIIKRYPTDTRRKSRLGKCKSSDAKRVFQCNLNQFLKQVNNLPCQD